MATITIILPDATVIANDIEQAVDFLRTLRGERPPTGAVVLPQPERRCECPTVWHGTTPPPCPAHSPPSITGVELPAR